MPAGVDMSLAQPFIDAVDQLFRTMLGQKATPGSPQAGATETLEKHLRATIAMSGNPAASMMLVMPESTALAAASALVGRKVTSNAVEFRDALGELANMIAGHAAARVPGRRLSICCPKVVVASGENRPVGAKPPSSSTDGTHMSIPFTAACGAFALEIRVAADAGRAKAA